MVKKKSSRKTSAQRTKKASRPVASGAKAAKKVKIAKKVARQATSKPKQTSRLGKASIEKFRQMLLEKRRDLIGDMNGIEAEALRTNPQEGSGDLSSMPTHPADLGTDNYEQEFTLGLLESERIMLKEINEAIQRVEDGTFGICLGTGKPINKARLTARPWAKYCIEYARLIEKGLVRPGEGNEEQR